MPVAGAVAFKATDVMLGVYRTAIEQLAPAASVVQLLVCVNCALESVIAPTVTGEPPALVRTTVFAGELVPIDCPPKSRVVGLADTAPAAAKVAVTLVALVRGTLQGLALAQPPPVHPAKLEPAWAVAVSATLVPEVKLAEQVAPQLIPAGEEVTVPCPVPPFATVRLTPGCCTFCTSVGDVLPAKTASPEYSALMLCAPTPMETVHGACPDESVVALHNVAAPSLNVTVPVGVPPVPDTVAVKVTACPVEGLALEASAVVVAVLGTNEAVTLAAAFMVMLQFPVPEHPPPDHPANLWPASGEAESVTTVPLAKLALQIGWHVIELGDDITEPEPERVTDSA